jgi:hypothetical protein
MRDLEQFALEGSIPDVSRDPEPGYQWSDYATRGDTKLTMRVAVPIRMSEALAVAAVGCACRSPA